MTVADANVSRDGVVIVMPPFDLARQLIQSCGG